MEFQDSDINFDKINWIQFEELCFDLLLKYQFHSLNWQQGAGDKGRDIEAVYSVVNSIVGSYQEKWFIECKHYKRGIPVDQISSKVDWAVAEKVQHFAIITNSHLSVTTKDFLNKRQKDVNFKIHIIDGKTLKQKLLSFPDLIVKYFADDITSLVKSLLKQWIFHDILPDLTTLFKLSKSIDIRKLNKEEKVFLYYVFESSNYNDVGEYETDFEEFSFDFLLPTIALETNSSFPIPLVIEKFGDRNMYTHGSGHEQISTRISDELIWHSLKEIDNGQLLSICLFRENKQVKVYISTKKRKEV